MAAEFYAVPHFQAQKKVWPHPICTSPPNCLGKWQNAEKEEIWEEGGEGYPAMQWELVEKD